MIRSPVDIGDRLPSPPSGWRWERLTDVARLATGHTPDRNRPDYWNGGIPWISLTEIRELDGMVATDTELKVSAEGVAHSSAVVLPPGTVCFSRTASIGFVTVTGAPMTTSQDFVNWICGDQLEPLYLMRALLAARERLRALSSGSTHKTIYMRVAEQFRVLVPPLEEQRRIAALLDSADAVRMKRRESCALLDTLVESAFVERFGASGSDDVATLGEIAEVQGGLQVSRARVGNPVEVPYLRVANVFRGRLDLSEIKLLRVTPSELQRSRLQKGDLLVVEGHGNASEVGRVAQWTGAIDDCVHQNHLIRVRVRPDFAHPDYVESALNTGLGRRQLKLAANTTSGLNTISTSDVRSVRLPLPSVELQKDFARFRRRAEESLGRVREHGAWLDALFGSVEQRAFSGAL